MYRYRMIRVWCLACGLIACVVPTVCVLAQEQAEENPFADDAPAAAPEASPAVDASAPVFLSTTIGRQAEAEQAILSALDSIVDVEYLDEPLEQVIQFLCTSKQIPIVLDHHAIEEEGQGVETPVTIQLKHVSLRSALTLLCKDLHLDFVIRDEVLLITTSDRAKEMMSVRVYPVEDLSACLGGGDSSTQKNMEALRESILAIIQPNTWSDVGGSGVIKPLSSTLVVLQTDRAHEQIARLLTTLRRAFGVQVSTASSSPRSSEARPRVTARESQADRVRAALLGHPVP